MPPFFNCVQQLFICLQSVLSTHLCLNYEQVIAESLSEEEIAGLREMFTAMDTDNSGAITYDELKEGLKKYGSTLNDTEIHDLMEAVSSQIHLNLTVAFPTYAKKLHKYFCWLYC